MKIIFFILTFLLFSSQVSAKTFSTETLILGNGFTEEHTEYTIHTKNFVEWLEYVTPYLEKEDIKVSPKVYETIKKKLNNLKETETRFWVKKVTQFGNFQYYQVISNIGGNNDLQDKSTSIIPYKTGVPLFSVGFQNASGIMNIYFSPMIEPKHKEVINALNMILIRASEFKRNK